MKIAVEARSLAQPRGIGRYASELLKALSKDGDIDVTALIASSEVASSLANLPHVNVPLQHEIFLQYWFNRQIPKAIQNLKPDVVHFTKSSISTRLDVPTVVTIHDIVPILFPASQSFLRKRYWPNALRTAAQKSNHIITLSEVSKKDIVTHLQVAPEKVSVTPLAVNLDFFKPANEEAQSVIRQKYSLNKPYILFLGTRDPRKNVAGLLRAFDAIAHDIPHDLVLVGRGAFGEDQTQATINDLKYSDRIRMLSVVDDSDLSALYTAATMLVLPSTYEGWGFPVQEAMACGTPVIVGSGGSLPEVVGDAGIVITYQSETIVERLQEKMFENELSQAMGIIAADEGLRHQLSEKGLKHIQSFSWSRVAKQTKDVYSLVVQNG